MKKRLWVTRKMQLYSAALLAVVVVHMSASSSWAVIVEENGRRYESVNEFAEAAYYDQNIGPSELVSNGAFYRGDDVYAEGSSGDIMMWRYIGDAGGGAGGSTAAGQPAASSSIAVNQFIRQNIFTRAQPRARPDEKPQTGQQEGAASESKPSFYKNIPGIGRLDSGLADAFYNKWEIGGMEGSTFGLNPSLTWGDASELTITVPLHVISPDEGDTLFALGFDGAFKHSFTGKWDNFSAGFHVFGMSYFGGDDTMSTMGGGPFLAWNYQINSKLIVSAGGLIEITTPDEGDTIAEIVPGINLGYNLTDNLALNGYVIGYKNTDRDVEEDTYADVGADIQWAKGSWSLSGGIKTATGLDDVSSTEIHLGSNWIF